MKYRNICITIPTRRAGKDLSNRHRSGACVQKHQMHAHENGSDVAISRFGNLRELAQRLERNCCAIARILLTLSYYLHYSITYSQTFCSHTFSSRHKQFGGILNINPIMLSTFESPHKGETIAVSWLRKGPAPVIIGHTLAINLNTK